MVPSKTFRKVIKFWEREQQYRTSASPPLQNHSNSMVFGINPQISLVIQLFFDEILYFFYQTPPRSLPLPLALQMPPRCLPNDSQMAPRWLSNVSRWLQDPSWCVPDASRSLQMLPDASRCASDASRCLPDACRCLPHASRCLPDTSGCLPGTSRCLPDASRRSQMLPDAFRCVPDASRCLQRCSSPLLPAVSKIAPPQERKPKNSFQFFVT